MCAAQNPAMMIVGRLFAGFASGINISIIPVYISEYRFPRPAGLWLEFKEHPSLLDIAWRIGLGMLASLLKVMLNGGYLWVFSAWALC
jgi:MFS family permease